MVGVEAAVVTPAKASRVGRTVAGGDSTTGMGDGGGPDSGADSRPSGGNEASMPIDAGEDSTSPSDGGRDSTSPVDSGPDVAVTYTIGGQLTNVSGTVVLQDNSGDNLSLSANGTFTFVKPLANGAMYDVTVLTQPANQFCSVTSGDKGSVASANVTTVMVNCVNTYSIGGQVSGLAPGESLGPSGQRRRQPPGQCQRHVHVPDVGAVGQDVPGHSPHASRWRDLVRSLLRPARRLAART